MKKKIFSNLGLVLMLSIFSLLPLKNTVYAETIENNEQAMERNTNNQLSITNTTQSQLLDDSNGVVTYALPSTLLPSFDTPEQYIKQLLSDDSITISNVIFTGSNKAASSFTNGSSIFGIESGVILSTGEVQEMNSNVGTPGDSDLDTMIGKSTYDAVTLEFDFVPKYSSLTFDYIFGSDEYPTFVGTSYNDSFAFFVNGTNVAFIPGTSDFVSINNVNAGKNSSYFVDNTDNHLGNLPGTAFGGITTVLPIKATVKPNATNHIKIVIADTSDRTRDSFVAISANSFKATGKVNIYYQDEKGNTLADNYIIDGDLGDPFSVTPIEIPGYNFDHWNGSPSGNISNSSVDVIAIYKKKVLIKFESNGGSLVENESFASGTIPTKPADPKRPGYTFDGWYADSTLKTKFDFSQPINVDTVVYAKWKKATGSGGSSNTPSTPIENETKPTCPENNSKDTTKVESREESRQSVVKQTGSTYLNNLIVLGMLVVVSIAGTVFYTVKIENKEA